MAPRRVSVLAETLFRPNKRVLCHVFEALRRGPELLQQHLSRVGGIVLSGPETSALRYLFADRAAHLECLLLIASRAALADYLRDGPASELGGDRRRTLHGKGFAVALDDGLPPRDRRVLGDEPRTPSSDATREQHTGRNAGESAPGRRQGRRPAHAMTTHTRVSVETGRAQPTPGLTAQKAGPHATPTWRRKKGKKKEN